MKNWRDPGTINLITIIMVFVVDIFMTTNILILSFNQRDLNFGFMSRL